MAGKRYSFRRGAQTIVHRWIDLNLVRHLRFPEKTNGYANGAEYH